MLRFIVENRFVKLAEKNSRCLIKLVVDFELAKL